MLENSLFFFFREVYFCFFDITHIKKTKPFLCKKNMPYFRFGIFFVFFISKLAFIIYFFPTIPKLCLILQEFYIQ